MIHCSYHNRGKRPLNTINDIVTSVREEEHAYPVSIKGQKAADADFSPGG